MSAFGTVARKSFNGKLTAQKWFSDRTFYVTITDADFRILKSLHTLFDKYLDHELVKFEQNRMVRKVQILVLFGIKMVNHF